MYYSYNSSDKKNKQSIIWLGFICAICLWKAVESPINFALSSNILEHHLWWDSFFSVIFALDVILRFTGKLSLPEHHKNEFMLELTESEFNPYSKSSWFFVDLLSAIPFDLIAYALSGFIPLYAIRLIRLCSLIKITKIRSLFHLIDFIPKTLKIITIAVTVMVAIHWFACGWMIISPRTEPDNISFYIVSLYWAITTLTTVGYGDVTPVTNIARIYTMAVMIVGVGVYGVIIGQFSRLMMLADKYTEERKEKMNGLNQYMKYYNIPYSLQRQVFSFYNHLLTQTISQEDSKIINDLPQALQNELNIYTKIKLLRNVHIFKDCSTPCLKMIAEKLEQTFHSPNEYIIRKGDIGSEMYIIGHGEVQVNHGEKVLAELKSGQFFGEIALIEDTVRSADIQTRTYCDIHTFKKEDFFDVTEKYPQLKERFKQLYRKRDSDQLEKGEFKEAA